MPGSQKGCWRPTASPVVLALSTFADDKLYQPSNVTARLSRAVLHKPVVHWAFAKPCCVLWPCGHSQLVHILAFILAPHFELCTPSVLFCITILGTQCRCGHGMHAQLSDAPAAVLPALPPICTAAMISKLSTAYADNIQTDITSHHCLLDISRRKMRVVRCTSGHNMFVCPRQLGPFHT